jgi:hypothetical protein
MKKIILSLVLVLSLSFAASAEHRKETAPVKHQFEIFAVSCNLP